LYRALDSLDEEIKHLNETEDLEEDAVVITNTAQSASGIKRLKDSQAAGISMTFDD
jgi:hypothetical protein